MEFTAAKVRLTPRSFGPPSVVVSRVIPEIIEPARRLLDALGYEGYSCTEFKRDPRDGVYKLMEVNGRFNLSSLLMLRCGINLPAMAYRHAVLGEAPTGIEQPEGMHWIDGTKDLVYGLPDACPPSDRPAGVCPTVPAAARVRRLGLGRCSSVRGALSRPGRRGYVRMARKVRRRLRRKRPTHPE